MDNNMSDVQKNRFPILVILFAVIGILAAVSKMIASWGYVKIFPAYISYAMSVYLYVSIIIFVWKGYKNPDNPDMKTYRNTLFKFCMMQLMAIITLRMGNIWYLVLSGIALLLAVIMYRDVTNRERNKYIVLIVMILVLIAAFIHVIDPLGSTSTLLEKLSNQEGFLANMNMYLPDTQLMRYVFTFDSFSQALQWLLIGSIYMFAYTRYINKEEK